MNTKPQEFTDKERRNSQIDFVVEAADRDRRQRYGFNVANTSNFDFMVNHSSMRELGLNVARLEHVPPRN